MNDISRFSESLERKITEVEQKTSTLRDHLSEATDKQVTIAGDSIDEADRFDGSSGLIKFHQSNLSKIFQCSIYPA